MKYPEIQALVAEQLRVLGYDPDSGDLRDTPRRVARAWEELLAGKDKRAEDVLGTVFDLDYPGMVISRAIPFYSLCEHHLIPFFGRADVAYIPDPETRKVVGLSKLARLVEMHARRLQIQERMTRDVAKDIDRVLSPLGVAVVVTAQHFCMCSRGVSKPGSEMITPVMLGVYFDQAPARAELMALLNQR